MIGLLVALLVGALFATGAYLLLRREPIKLILGLSLISYGINVLLFATSTLRRGAPPIIENKEAFAGEIEQFVDPVPQALILTAIVISFGVTAFIVVLLKRRNSLVREHTPIGEEDFEGLVNDPFSDTGLFQSGLDLDPDDFEWLEDLVQDTSTSPAPPGPVRNR
jgi:multicomponent Na+:H+ antiporter subunit C